MKPTAILSQYRHARCGGLRISLMLSTPLLFLGLSACAILPLDGTVASVARAIGIEQVRDPLTGRVYFVACNPCAAHTPKTALNAATRPVTNALPGVSALTAMPLAAVTPNVSSMPVRPAQVQGNEPVAVSASSTGETAESRQEVDVRETIKRTVNFDLGQASLASLGRHERSTIDEVALLANQAERVLVRGCTDTSGPVALNTQIAQARAATVRQKLIAAKVPGERISVSYCLDCFVASNDTASGRRANRRVDVELMSVEKRMGEADPVRLSALDGRAVMVSVY